MTTLALIVLAGYVSFFTSRKADGETFFTGNRTSPWYLVAFGMIGASLSGVTFVSIPGEVGNSGWTYLPVVLGNCVGYAVIALVLLPLFYRLKLISIYSWLGNRFGESSRLTGSFFFIISQLIGASFRLFLVVGVLQLAVFDALGIPFAATVLIDSFRRHGADYHRAGMGLYLPGRHQNHCLDRYLADHFHACFRCRDHRHHLPGFGF